MKNKIRLFLNGLDFRIAIKTGIAASCSYFVAKEYAHFFNRPDLFLSGLWCVVTTIVVMQANVGGTYRAGWVRFLGIIIGSIFGALGGSLFWSDNSGIRNRGCNYNFCLLIIQD